MEINNTLKFKFIDICAGYLLDEALKKLKENSDENTVTYCNFNDNILYSTDTLDIAYLKVTGRTKAENDKFLKEKQLEQEKREQEFKEKLPSLIELYKTEARGVILDSELEFWDKIVPIRLNDLYHGMELEQTLEISKIMGNEEMDYNTRLHIAYDCFMNSGHSGMSASLTAAMLKKFCPHGEDIADAVMNFRFQ